MVKYLLSVEKKRGTYEEIDWAKVSPSGELDGHKLASIDSFTSLFSDISEMKEYLVKKGIISLSDYERKVVIRYKSKGVMKNLRYGLVFKKDSKFLDPTYITSYLLKHKDDLNLIEKLCNHYRNSYIQGTNTQIMRRYITKVSNNLKIDSVDIKEYESAIKDFVLRECYTYDPETYTYKVDENGEPKLKYKSLHDLGIFLSYSINKFEKAKSDIKIVVETPKIKELTYEYRQMTIFDYMKKQD